MEKQKLEIGTEIYLKHYGQISSFGKVDRVTEKFAMVRNTRFRREHDGRNVYVSKRETWATTIYFIPDKNDVVAFKKQQVVSYLKGYDWGKLSYTELIDVVGVLKSRA